MSLVKTWCRMGDRRDRLARCDRPERLERLCQPVIDPKVCALSSAAWLDSAPLATVSAHHLIASLRLPDSVALRHGRPLLSGPHGGRFEKPVIQQRCHRSNRISCPSLVVVRLDISDDVSRGSVSCSIPTGVVAAGRRLSSQLAINCVD